MFESDLSFYLALLILCCPISIVFFKKFPIKGYTGANKVSLFLQCLIAILNLNILYSFINSLTITLGHDGSSANTLTIDPITTTQQQGHVDYTPIKVSGYTFKNQVATKNLQCDSIVYDQDLDLQVSQAVDLNKPEDLKFFRDKLNELRSLNNIYDLFFQDNEDEVEESILERKWYKFCGSAVWLDKYGVYFMVNRIAYSKKGTRNNPTISVLAGQVFDKNWIELTGKKFPFSGLEFPTILPHYIDEGKEAEKVILGAEDPRAILHEYTNENGIRIQEPLIAFNALSTEVDWKRAMHIYRPLHDPHRIIRLSIENYAPREKEKNWAPFIDGNNLNFVYNFPLRILRCNINNGDCQKVSGPDFNDKSHENAGKLRGGTNLVEIPSQSLPKHLRSRKYWFGIARSHITDCGCVGELYRPHLILISRNKKSDQYELNYVSDLIDFNVNPEPWTPGKTTCSDGKLVLIPNSVAFIKDDYMSVTFSEADKTNKLINAKGWLTYITKMLEFTQERLKDESSDPVLESRLLSKCSTFLAQQYCALSKDTMGWDKLSR